MSYLNNISNIRTMDETLSVNTNESYSYSDFMRDMVMIENAIAETVNNYAKESNDIAFELLTEASEGADDKIKEKNEGFKEKLKKFWQMITEKFVQFINFMFTKIGDYINRNKLWLSANKKKIMNGILVHSDDAHTDDKKYIVVNYNKLSCYENLFKTFKNVKLDPDTDNAIKFFDTEFLGDKTSIDIDLLNIKRPLLFSNYDAACDAIIKTKNELSKIKRSIPSNITEDELNKYKKEVETATTVAKIKIKALTKYCREIVSILGLFIDNSGAESLSFHTHVDDTLKAHKEYINSVDNAMKEAFKNV